MRRALGRLAAENGLQRKLPTFCGGPNRPETNLAHGVEAGDLLFESVQLGALMSETSENKLCFVIGPIGPLASEIRKHADWLLDGIIRPAMKDFPDFKLKRADYDARPGLIDVQMINDIINADLVIADLSLNNPNAFYEIGIRHMSQKPIIHMQLAAEESPFDVSQYRAIRFSYDRHSELGKAQEELKRFVTSVLEPGFQTENPVTHAIGRRKLELTATPEIQVIMQEIDQIKSQLKVLGLDDLGLALSMVVTDSERRHLQNLEADKADDYKSNSWLLTELRRLRALGLIHSKGNFSDIPSSGMFNLAEYAEVTPKGKDYLRRMKE